MGDQDRVSIDVLPELVGKTALYPLVPTVNVPPKWLNGLLEPAGPHGDRNSNVWILFARPDQTTFSGGLRQASETINSGFTAYEDILEIARVCREKFDHLEGHDPPILREVITIIDEQSLQDQTVVILEGALERAGIRDNAMGIGDDASKIRQDGLELVWRWVRVFSWQASDMLACAHHKGLATYMVEDVRPLKLLPNGSFYDLDI